MFTTLIVSRPRAKRTWRRGLAGPTLSMVVHAVVLYAAVMATMPAATSETVVGTDTSLIYVPSHEPRTPAPPPPILSGTFRMPEVPATILTSIPPIDVNPKFDPRDYLGRGIEPGLIPGADGALDPTEVYIDAVVDEPPIPVSFRPPRYPPLLLQARIAGSVLLEAIIDTLGHPEPASIQVISASNRAFESAAKDALRKALFRPGRVQGQRVRVLVRQPIKFQLPK